MSRIAAKKKSQQVEIREDAINAMVSNVASAGKAAGFAGGTFISLIPLDQIEFDGENARAHLDRDNPALIDPSHKDAEEMQEVLDHCRTLAMSIERFGLYSAIQVRVDRNDPNRFHMVAGHCRWYAMKLLGWNEAPAIEMNQLTPEEVRLVRQSENSSRLDIKGYRVLMSLYRDVLRSYEYRYKRDSPDAVVVPEISSKDFDDLLEEKLKYFSSRTARHRYRSILSSASPVRNIFISGRVNKVHTLDSLAARCKKDPDFYLPLVDLILQGKSHIVGTSILSVDGSHPEVSLADSKAPAFDQARHGTVQPQNPTLVAPPNEAQTGGLSQSSSSDFGDFGDNLMTDADVAATLSRIQGAGGADASNTSAGSLTGHSLIATPVTDPSSHSGNADALTAAKQQRSTERNRSGSRELVVQQPDAIKFLSKTICEQLGIPLPKTQWESAMSGIATLKNLCKQLDQHAADGKLEV